MLQTKFIFIYFVQLFYCIINCIFVLMDFKDYLQKQQHFTLVTLAAIMWPDNKTSFHYLSKKLNGLQGRKWTDKDEKLARKALKELGIILTDNSKVKNGGEFNLHPKKEEIKPPISNPLNMITNN